jgi:hypothetical protein
MLHGEDLQTAIRQLREDLRRFQKKALAVQTEEEVLALYRETADRLQKYQRRFGGWWAVVEPEGREMGGAVKDLLALQERLAAAKDDGEKRAIRLEIAKKAKWYAEEAIEEAERWGKRGEAV